MKKFLCLLSGLLLLTGCASSEPISESREATAESVQEYSVNLMLTTSTPGHKEFASANNGESWTESGEPIEIGAVPAYLTMEQPDSISMSSEDSLTLTIHNGCDFELHGGINYEVERFNGTDWVAADYSDPSTEFVNDDLSHTIHPDETMEFGVYLGFYAPVEGRYRIVQTFDAYKMTAEFNALA